MPTQDFKGTINGRTPPDEANTLKGDGVAGRVIRHILLVIDNGTNPSTLKCRTDNVWNGDAVGNTDNIAKGGTTGNFALNAGGTILTFLNSGISGNAVDVSAVWIYGNVSGAAIRVGAMKTASGIDVYWQDVTSGALQDMTVLVDTGAIQADITYISSA